MKTNPILISIFILIFLLNSCKKDEKLNPVNPAPVNQQELITTVKLIFTDSANTSFVSSFNFRDPDGEGGNAPMEFDTIQLNANKTYWVSILLLDESKSPIDTISNEVLDEANDHQFFFHHAGVSVSTTYSDLDSNNPPQPIGLQTKWKSGMPSSGTSQIILKHQPGTKNGSEANGETDVDLLFTTIVQ